MTQSGACLSRRLQMNEPGSVTTPNMFTFSLTFVRHGETQYNRDKLLQGQGVDTLLSETGAEQGEAVGRYLSDVRFSRVFVSNLQRAVQTAEIILRNSTHCSGMEMILEPLLRERGFGVAEGRPKEDLKNMANAAGQSCRDYTPPGGETLEQVRSRFQKFLKLLFEQMLPEPDSCESEPSDTTNGAAAAASAAGAAPTDGAPAEPSAHVLVVSHGAYIRVAARHLLENLKCSLPPGAKASQLLTPCPNTGVSRYVLTLRRSEAGPVLSSARCLFTNRKEHLETLSAAQ